MKTAKEMFKELKYDTIRKDDYQLIYKRFGGYKIVFDINYQTFYKEDFFNVSLQISMQELQAINKQCEELGWIDEETN